MYIFYEEKIKRDEQMKLMGVGLSSGVLYYCIFIRIVMFNLKSLEDIFRSEIARMMIKQVKEFLIDRPREIRENADEKEDDDLPCKLDGIIVSIKFFRSRYNNALQSFIRQNPKFQVSLDVCGPRVAGNVRRGSGEGREKRQSGETLEI